MLARFVRRALLAVLGLLAVVALLALLYIGHVAWTTRTAVAATDGSRAGIPVDGPVTIARDARDVPHIRADSVHDLFVAEGYAMGSDRLFQMDATRRFVYGRLAELLGNPVVRVDRRMRRYRIAEAAARVYAATSPRERSLLQAFADGINAAATREPVPPEYRALFAGFEPWKPEDSLAVGFATVLDLDDRPDDVIVRDQVRKLLGSAGTDALYPATDPRYDVPTDGTAPGTIARLPDLPPPASTRDVTLSSSKGESASRTPGDSLTLRQAQGDLERPPVGSNAWIAGAARTANGRAMLANDPHLDLAIPGIWYLVEASAPGMHVAGAALAGTPGVTLGHNEHLAWGVTAGEAAAMQVTRVPARGDDEFFVRGAWTRARHRTDAIRVRFGGTVDAVLLETDDGVVIARRGGDAYLLRWRWYDDTASPLAPFLALLTAKSAADGVAAMRGLPEPSLNVVFADDGGRVAYHFAGGVPLDASFGRWADPQPPARDALLGYDAAPHVDPSRDALVVTSNNRPDGAGPRLAPFWPPPYRAYEIHRALGASGAHGKLTEDEFAAPQRDLRSPAEREFATIVLAAAARRHAERDTSLARVLAALRAFDGTMSPESRGATAVVALRLDMLGALAAAHLPSELARAYPPSSPGFEVVLRALRERPRGWVAGDDYDAFVMRSLEQVAQQFGAEVPSFGTYAAQPDAHALAPFGFKSWNGPTFPGHGGSFAPAVQWNGHSQSFRAVWIAGDWDRGTIDIPAGESGEPGSPHYADLADNWTKFGRTPLPFSDAAVRAATRSTLTLTR
ncbi:MAG TPA: penicillin acylase family protein [Candidatus Limnocylindrales bacterium]|nr:penicillin acylase family protein [Candidatus Limnocylindrales bacterium]